MCCKLEFCEIWRVSGYLYIKTIILCAWRVEKEFSYIFGSVRKSRAQAICTLLCVACSPRVIEIIIVVNQWGNWSCCRLGTNGLFFNIENFKLKFMKFLKLSPIFTCDWGEDECGDFHDICCRVSTKNKLKKISLWKSYKESLLWVFSCSGAINIKEVSWRVGREDPSRIGGARVTETENA